MGTLVCPLCCEEEFSNQLSLRYHLLSITDNVYCPECNERFDSILQLANHLDGMCGKAGLSIINEETSDSDMDVAEEYYTEIEMLIPETVISNEGDSIDNEFEEMIEKKIGTHYNDSYPLSQMSEKVVEKTVDTVIKNASAKVTGQQLQIGHASCTKNSIKVEDHSLKTDDWQTTRNEKEMSAVPKELLGFGTDKYVQVVKAVTPEIVEFLPSAETTENGDSEKKNSEPKEDTTAECIEYSCSCCGVTFSSVMEHIKMYHTGQEIVIEVPEADKGVLDTLITASDEVTDIDFHPAIVTSHIGDEEMNVVEESSNVVSSSVVSKEQLNSADSESQDIVSSDAFMKYDHCENAKRSPWSRIKTRVVADEEKIKNIVPAPKKGITFIEEGSTELTCISSIVKNAKFWQIETNEACRQLSKDTGTANIAENSNDSSHVAILVESGKNENFLLRKDTRTSIEKLFSGNFLLKGTGGRGTRPGPYLGVNRVPEVKVIMSPGDKGAENAISVYTCSTCQKEFGNVSAFKRHSCTLSKTPSLVCKLCEADIIDMEALQLHMEAVHNLKTEVWKKGGMAKRRYNVKTFPNPVKCQSCDMAFTTMRALKLHNRMHERTELKTLECPVCHTVCSSNRTLNQHMRVHSKSVPVKKSSDEDGAEVEPTNVSVEQSRILGLLVCKVCYKSFRNNEELREHWQEHVTKEEEEGKEMEETDNAVRELEDTEADVRNKNTSPCEQCHKEIDKSCKEEHMAKHFSTTRYSCCICNKSFTKHGHLNMHMQIHRGVKEYSCVHCGKILANMNLLRTHIQSHIIQRPYLCGFCGRGFFRPHDKVEHERIHTGEKPHQCSVCGMRFRVRYCLTLHMRRHTGIRPYSCWMCRKTFRTGTAYKAHTKIHLDERAYRCPFCPKKFNTLIQLSGHKNSHTKPYTCTECNRPFSSLYAVRKHMSSHEEGISGKDPLKFQCQICGASYARKFALRDHLKSHGQNISPAPTGRECSDDSSNDVS